MSGVTVQQLWDDFIFYQAKTGNFIQRRRDNPYIRAMKPTPERLRFLEQLIIWCAEHDVPPRQWLFSLFAIRRWMFAPKLETGYLCSKNHLKKFATFSDYSLYTQRMQDLATANTMADSGGFDPNRDISHTAEEEKRVYVAGGRTDICIAQMKVETFGYHPKSKVCVACVQRELCESALNASVQFDIGALRRGEITAVEAYRQAIARGQQRHG